MVDRPRVSTLLHRIREEVAALRRIAGRSDNGLAQVLADAARFRNLLVHQYGDVDDRRVVEIMRTRLDDLDTYVNTIAARVQDEGA